VAVVELSSSVLTRHGNRMSADSLHLLLGLLDLEPLEVNIYRGQNRDLGTGRVYGGQVFAQALVAARRTVDDNRDAHSAHGYFILPGDLNAPIVYFVDRLRDGSSFTTRRVTAIQHGRAIFNLSASFHIAEAGPEHQAPPLPDVPHPDTLTPELQLLRDMADRIPESIRSVVTQERLIDVRPIDPIDPTSTEKRAPSRRAWIRAAGRLPDDPGIHQAALAYASDYGLLVTALQPTAFRIARTVCSSRRSTTPFGCTAPSAPMSGCSTPPTAPSRRVRADSCAAPFTRRLVSWWHRWRRRG